MRALLGVIVGSEQMGSMNLLEECHQYDVTPVFLGKVVCGQTLVCKDSAYCRALEMSYG